MKFFSAAPISTPTFRPAQFPAPQRQSAATDTGTQPTPQEPAPVVTGFKPETRSKNVQLASPSAVAPDPQVVPAAQTPQVFQGPSATAPVQPVEETYPHSGQVATHGPAPTDPNHPAMIAWNQIKDAAVQKWRETGQWTQPPSYQSWYDQYGWSLQSATHGPAPTDPNHPAMIAWNQIKDAAVQKWRETGQWTQPPSYQSWYDQYGWSLQSAAPPVPPIAIQPPLTTTTVAPPQQGMVVPKSARFMDPYATVPAPVQPGTTYSDPELTRMQAVNGQAAFREASHTGANPRALGEGGPLNAQGPKPITPAAQAAKYTAARNRSGIYTGLAR